MHYGSPLLILAGAGSGKTRVLTHKIAYIVEKGFIRPENILAVTFTNKAAREMRERVHSMMPPHLGNRVTLSTFHSLGVQILRRYGSRIGLNPGFSIYDDSDQQSVIKKIIKKLNLNDKVITPKFCQSRINNVKAQAMTERQIMDQKLLFNKEFAQLFREYEKELAQSNAVDFGDLIYKTLKLIEGDELVRGYLQDQYQYLLVDEYQDTNASQYRMMRGLVRDTNNICVVGDEDQSIYGWRGADITNILNFEKDFGDTTIIKLEQNYRSTKNIITAAQAVIANNTERHDKTLFTENPSGEKVKIVELDNEYEEGQFVAERVKALHNHVSLNEIAIFYRTNAQSRILEEQLRSASIPYRLYGGVRFYDRKEIKDVVSYMLLILNPRDDLAFKRVVNVPTRGLGKTTMDIVEETGLRHGINMIDAAIQAVTEKQINPRACQKMGAFLDMIVRLRERMKTLDIYSVYQEILDQTGYLKELESDNTQESQARIENLQEFGNAILRFSETHHEEATLDKFLNDMALASDADKDDDSNKPAVTMMTLHISKGLEFPYVFMVGLEDGLFPSTQSIEEQGSKIEEERRLCYVGMTRAEKELFMCHARSRRHWGEHRFNPPSRFLDEVPAELVEVMSAVQKRPSFMQKGVYSQKAPKPTQQFDAFPDYENFSDSTDARYKVGAKVRHPIFGAGAIHSVEGSGDNIKVGIVFRDNTVKKFYAKHANLTLI